MSFLHINLPQLIEAAGYLGLFGIIFAESGLFFGFFFPGDSLIFTAGILASQHYLSLSLLLLLLPVAAVSGDSFGYFFGKRVGPALFSRKDSFFFKRRHLERTREFYAKHGPRTIILARIIPIVRTFAP
ncbi:MAG TPA: VTT domain-containing protein, partial [Candidatus Paceibacterota bacterium]